jgi:hypothetical protein
MAKLLKTEDRVKVKQPMDALLQMTKTELEQLRRAAA